MKINEKDIAINNNIVVFVTIGILILICILLTIIILKCSSRFKKIKNLNPVDLNINENNENNNHNNMENINMNQDQDFNNLQDNFILLNKNNLEILNKLLSSKIQGIKYNEKMNIFKVNCTICLENFISDSLVIKLFCKHIFHFQCLKNLMLKNRHNSELKCPNCKNEVMLFTLEDKSKENTELIASENKMSSYNIKNINTSNNIKVHKENFNENDNLNLKEISNFKNNLKSLNLENEIDEDFYNKKVHFKKNKDKKLENYENIFLASEQREILPMENIKDKEVLVRKNKNKIDINYNFQKKFPENIKDFLEKDEISNVHSCLSKKKITIIPNYKFLNDYIINNDSDLNKFSQSDPELELKINHEKNIYTFLKYGDSIKNNFYTQSKNKNHLSYNCTKLKKKYIRSLENFSNKSDTSINKKKIIVKN